MLKNILLSADEIKVFNNNSYVYVENIRELLNELFEGAYMSVSYIEADNDTLQLSRASGIWIELNYKTTIEFKNYRFDRLLFTVKPKFDFINIYRNTDGIYKGKCLSINLSNNTTALYNYLKDKKDK